MGDSTCLLHGFSYASAIPNESKQGNPMHVLGESISFGRFTSESLSWERWSTFSHKKYVEEAERYAKPGSVAQKKAFFEAHYKRIAAQKAAALLEQQNAAAKTEVEEHNGNYSNANGDDDQERVILDSQVDVEEQMEEVKIQNIENENVNKDSLVSVEEVIKEEENALISEIGDSDEIIVKRDSNSINQLNILENQETVSGSDGSGTPQIERPLLKNCVGSEDIPSVTSKKTSSFSSLKSSIRRKKWRVPLTPAKPATTPHFKKENNVIIQSTRKSNVESSMDRKRSSPKSLRQLIDSIPIKAPDKEKPVISGIEPSSSRTPKDCSKTPLRTPIMPAKRGVSKYPAVTPLSDNRRMKTPIEPGAKTAGPKWHILSTAYSKSVTACLNKLQSPTLSTPFTLRTEERAAKRKQKLEEKFNDNVAHKAQVQKTLKEKAENEFSKLGCTFCFKARPLPDFYKERAISTSQMKKTPVVKSQTAVLGRNLSNKTQQGTVSMPTPPTLKSFIKNGASNNSLLKKKSVIKGKSLVASFNERITHENKSPNIQH